MQQNVNVNVNTKKRKRPLLLPEEMDPAMYIWWRRRAQESSLLYTVTSYAHQCWTQRQEVEECTNSLGERLYGCLRCGRSHICVPPEYFSCPRITSQSNPDAMMCAFSGNEIGILCGTINSSFNQYETTLTALRERNAGAYLGGGYMRSGFQMGMRLHEHANFSEHPGTQRSMRKQGDEAIQQGQDHAITHRYLKTTRRNTFLRAPKLTAAAAGGGGSNRMDTSSEEDAIEKEEEEEEKEDAETAAERLKMLELMAALPTPTTSLGDSILEKDEMQREVDHSARVEMNAGPLEPLWTLPPVIIPDREMRADDAYLHRYLDPVCEVLEQQCRFSVFSPPSASKKLLQTEKKAPDTHKNNNNPTKQQPLKKKKRVDFSVYWRILQPNGLPRDMLKHQRLMQDYLQRFLEHYVPLTPKLAATASKAPDNLQRYLLFSDRLLWFYHNQKGLRDGSLWPMKKPNVLQRILFMILTSILIQPEYARDPVSDAKIFLWVEDPWLAACSKAGLFAQSKAPGHILPRSDNQLATGNPVNLSNMRASLLSILKLPSVSPHALSLFLLPPVLSSTIPADHSILTQSSSSSSTSVESPDAVCLERES